MRVRHFNCVWIMQRKQYEDLWGDLVSCNAHTDPQHILWLGDRMLASPEKAVSQCASSVFIAIARCAMPLSCITAMLL